METSAKEILTILLLITVSLLPFSQTIFADNIQEENINVYEEISISLEENPSTGYRWHYHIENQDIAEVIKDEFVEEECPPGKLGCGGMHNWLIRGLKPGQTVVIFKLHREGSREVIEKRRHLINVIPEVIEVEKYDLFLVELPENVSTGYKWHLVSDNQIILFIGEEYRQSVDGSDNVDKSPSLGVGGIRQCYLFALKKGQTTLRFELYRDKEDIVDRRFYKIIVN